MANLVPADQIEALVSARRHSVKHLGRHDTATDTIYILHSEQCRAQTDDLRDCAFSIALDDGVDEDDWDAYHDRPIALAVDSEGFLCPWDVAVEREQPPAWSDHSEPIVYLESGDH